MGQSTLFTVLVGALVIDTLSYCSAENVYCVTPTATSCLSCPQKSNHCATLSEYAQEVQVYFTSNTTIVFLPGDNVLDLNITVANVTRLTMRGESFSDNKATVVRNGSVGFSFTNIVDFNIYSLAITSHNSSWDHGSHPASRSALLLQSTQYGNLVNCSFHNNLGIGLTVHHTNISLAANNEFMDNHCACESFTDTCRLGCAITALNSTLTFTGNTTFSGNRRKSLGPFRVGAGALLAINSLLSFSGTNNFINNINSVSGGAIYITNNTVLTLHGTNSFINNSAERYGGAIYTSYKTVLNFTGTTKFSSNSAKYGGGAIYTEIKTSLAFTGSSEFSDNSAEFNGGVISVATNIVLTFSGTSNFINNSAERYGGAVYTSYNTVLIFTGTTKFHGNTATYGGGAIYAEIKTSLAFMGTSEFRGNSAEFSGGAILVATNIVLTFNGTNNFINNSAEGSGGVIRTFNYVVLNFSGISNFISNSANNNGGAIYAVTYTSMKFIGTTDFSNNSAKGESGGAIYAKFKISLTFTGSSDFNNNTAKFGGGAIYTLNNAVITFSNCNSFTNNSANNNGGAIYAATYISLSFNGTSSFSNNLAMQGGAIYANLNSTLIFNGSLSFDNNANKFSADIGVSSGGAIFMSIRTTVFILPHTTVCWKNNHASLGGAIYVYDANPLIYCTQIATFISREECFIQLPGQKYANSINVKLVFINNSADDAGSVLYGGTLDNCELTGLESYKSGEVFDMLFHNNDTNYNTTSNISSDPFLICPCKHNLPDCSRSSTAVRYPSVVYPGETFQISVVSAGQRDGTVSSTVRSTARSNTISHFHSIDPYQYLQHTNNTCTKLNYTVFSLSREVDIQLHPEGSPCSNCNIQTLNYLVYLYQTCPPGFNISESERSCVCEPRLAQYTKQCNITNGLGQITRDSHQHLWVGYDNLSHELILHPYCPLDYCVNDKKVFPLNNTDLQCAYSRSGLLCGHCKKGYSLALGTSHCKKCTNIYLLLLVAFAVMGVALILFLFVCKVTVATGTLSGLVFYANIVGVNRTIFLPGESTDAFSVFITWLNLDFGIETCFYNGMDAYSNTWLQFVFPVYLWVLVGLVILISHYSQMFANLLGSNPVSVLSTLILLSYAKILRTLIAVFYITYLEYPENSRRVWLYDASIDYLVGKHIPLFLVALLVFFFLFLPYTLVLLCSQWLQAVSHLRLFSWVNSARLKPFLDSYHAPYKAKHRYWPGLLLVLRFILLLVFALNPQQDSNINLLAIVVGAGILQLWAWVSGGVYKAWCLDALEGSFTLNLTILGAATYYIKLTEGNKLAVGYTSVTVALLTFTGIVVYHLLHQLTHTKLWKKLPKLTLKLNKQNTNVETSTNNHLHQLRETLLDELPQTSHHVF